MQSRREAMWARTFMRPARNALRSRRRSLQPANSQDELAAGTEAGNDESCTAHRCPNQNVMEVTSRLLKVSHVPARAIKCSTVNRHNKHSRRELSGWREVVKQGPVGFPQALKARCGTAYPPSYRGKIWIGRADAYRLYVTHPVRWRSVL